MEPRPLFDREERRESARPVAEGPKPLDFSSVAVTPTPAPAKVGVVLFGNAGSNRLLDSAEAAALRRLPAASAEQRADLSRWLSKLLPVSEAGLLDYAANLLTRNVELTQAIAHLTQLFTKVAAGDRLAALTGKREGMWEAMQKKVLGIRRPAPEVELETIRRELGQLKPQVGEVLQKAEGLSRRLTMALLALRAVEEISPKEQSALRDQLERRQDILRAAALQGDLLVAQAKNLKDAMAGQLQRCDQVYAVLLPARTLNGALEMTKRP